VGEAKPLPRLRQVSKHWVRVSVGSRPPRLACATSARNGSLRRGWSDKLPAMMEQRSFAGRTFQLWEYHVGHKQLLLRSTKESDHPTRVEVAFKNVRALKIPTVMRDLSISLASDSVATAARAQTGTDSGTVSVFALVGSGFEGYVIAGVAFGHEDEGEYSDPSPCSLDDGRGLAGR
jgi:hypothetical protein